MITGRVDTKGLELALQKIENALPTATREGVVAIAQEAVTRASQRWPIDTARSLRGWLQAANEAGLGPFPLPALRPAKWLDRITKEINEWASDAESWVKKMEQQAADRGADPLSWKSYRKAVKHRDRYLQMAKDLAESNGAVIGLNLNRRGDRNPSVRVKVYGGRGSAVVSKDGAAVILTNMEPHARFVEMKTRIMRTAIAEATIAGRDKGHKAFADPIKKAKKLTGVEEVDRPEAA